MLRFLLLFSYACCANLGHFASPENHYYRLNSTLGETFKFVVFTDPQFGKYDIKLGTSEGTVWEDDINRTIEMCHKISQIENVAFIVSAGDLAEAFPNVEKPELGSQPALRPQQTLDFMLAMGACPSGLDIFTIPGNHDVGYHVTERAAWIGYEKQFMQSFYYFRHGERYFISLDSEIYKQTDGVAVERRSEQNEWLEVLFRLLPRDAPKTVFMHTPLFIESPDEVLAAKQGESIPVDHRAYLIDQFSRHNVDTVFSGHTHFENVPPVYRGIQQIVLTSINYLKTWVSPETGAAWGPNLGNNERGFYVVDNDGTNVPTVNKILL